MAPSVKVQIQNESLMRFAVHRAIMRGAHGGVTALRRSLSDTVGSGKHYGTLPNSSSAPGEYPTKQTGELLDSIGMQVQGEGEVGIGIIRATEAMRKLEFDMPSEGGRAPISKAFYDESVRAEILAAIRSGL